MLRDLAVAGWACSRLLAGAVVAATGNLLVHAGEQLAGVTSPGLTVDRSTVPEDHGDYRPLPLTEEATNLLATRTTTTAWDAKVVAPLAGSLAARMAGR